MSNITINPESGSLSQSVSVSGECNPGIDVSFEYKIKTKDGSKSKTFVVNQEGKREELNVVNGDQDELFLLSDGSTFNVVKEKYKSDPDCHYINIITIDQNNTDPDTIIEGDINGSIIQWIKANSHIVLAKKTSEGNVTYCRLDDSNSNYYHDGTVASLDGSEGDVMMKLPTFFTKSEEVSSNVWNISFSDKNVDGTWMEWGTNDLIGVYEAYVDSSKLYSRSGVASTGFVPQANFKTYARNRGTGYTLVKHKHQNIMAFLYYAMYGNTNCQATIGKGTSSCTKTTGQTNSLGMNDTVAGGNGDADSIKFWGLENWWGNKCEWVDNVVVNPDSVNGIWRITEDDGTTRDVQGVIGSGYPTQLVIGQHLDAIALNYSGSDSTGYCDYQYVHDSFIGYVVYRSYLGASTYGGVVHANAGEGSSFKNDNYGSRLAYYGDMTEIEDVSQFKALV